MNNPNQDLPPVDNGADAETGYKLTEQEQAFCMMMGQRSQALAQLLLEAAELFYELGEHWMRVETFTASEPLNKMQRDQFVVLQLKLLRVFTGQWMPEVKHEDFIDSPAVGDMAAANVPTEEAPIIQLPN